MAKNWKPGEAAEAVKESKVSDILDLGRRFPLFATTVAAATAGDVESMIKILDALPEYCTVRKIESALKGEASDDDAGENDGDEDAEKEKPAKTEKAGKLTKAGLMKKSPKELMTLAKAAEIEIMSTKKFKAMDGDEKKEALVAAILKAQAAAKDDDGEDAEDEKPAKSGKAKDKAKDDDWDDEDGEDEKPKKGGKEKAKAKDDDDDWDI